MVEENKPCKHHTLIKMGGYLMCGVFSTAFVITALALMIGKPIGITDIFGLFCSFMLAFTGWNLTKD
jgi:hypothetical protein